jgi:GNAT superfamily N-acetyltransferase
VGGRPVKITIERVVDVGSLYDSYVAAFGPLRTRAAARHLLSREEFAAEMADERIEKYVARTGDGTPIGLATLTADLSAVPWVSPEFYAARYPEHAARGALLYLGYTLVHPDHEKQGVFARIAARIVRRCHEARAVCAFDVCGYNDDVHGIARSIAALSRSLPVKVETVDVQTYYGAVFG